MGLGSINAVSLSKAREKAGECRQLLRDGIDPIERRKAGRAQRQVEDLRSKTFKHCADKYISSHSAGWKNVKHASQWENTLKTYVYPVFGDLPVQSVDTALVIDVLESIWREKTETASRVRGRIEAILDWASARKYREGENPARWKGHLDKLLPAPSKVRKVKHHPALPYKVVGDFVKTLREETSISALCLEFTILTASRTVESTQARWEEIGTSEKVWTIPASRMKGSREHRVPLSEPALDVLVQMEKLAQNEYVFPGLRPKSPLSNMSMLQTLKRMGRKDITVHGFRSTFKDWASEITAYPNELSEMALSHAVGDRVEAAYRRGDLFDKRSRMMADWAKYCSKPSVNGGNNVVTMKNRQG